MKENNKIKAATRYLLVSEDESPQRLDNFLFNKLKNIPKSRIYRMIRGGEVRVNKKRIKPLYKLQAGDELRIPPLFEIESQGATTKPSSSLINLLLNNIIFEDKKIIVLNKPPGVASHGGSGINFGVIEALREAKDGLKDLELVHRLDRDTSGCMILAKKKSVLRELHRLIMDHKILKRYLLLVKGKWLGGKRVVSLPLVKNNLKSGERMVIVSESGKESTTIFRPIKVGDKMSLVEAELKTGRTHQIRVHAAKIAYPIAGDTKYGDPDFNQEMKKHGLKRMFLHASKLDFYWEDGVRASFKAEIGNDLKMVLT